MRCSISCNSPACAATSCSNASNRNDNATAASSRLSISSSKKCWPRGTILARASAKALRPNKGIARTARVIRCKGAFTKSANNNNESKEVANSACTRLNTDLRISAKAWVKSSITTSIAPEFMPLSSPIATNDNSNCLPW